MYGNKASYLKSILSYVIVILIVACCNKNDEEINNDTDDLHLGWHESMTGDIIFTEEYIEQDNDVCDQLKIINKYGIIDLPLPDSVFHINGIALSPDNSKISFASPYLGLYSMDRDGTNTKTEYSDRGCGRVTWSSDGVSVASITLGSILIINFQNGEYSLINPSGGDWGLRTITSWSLDWITSTTNIIYNTGSGPPNAVINNLYVLDVSDNSCEKNVDNVGYQAECSPDGLKIAHAKHMTDSAGIAIYANIFITSMDGLETYMVKSFADSQDSVICYDLTWSPDGDLIAVGSRTGIYVFDLDGITLTKIPAIRCINIDWK